MSSRYLYLATMENQSIQSLSLFKTQTEHTDLSPAMVKAYNPNIVLVITFSVCDYHFYQQHFLIGVPQEYHVMIEEMEEALRD